MYTFPRRTEEAVIVCVCVLKPQSRMAGWREIFLLSCEGGGGREAAKCFYVRFLGRRKSRVCVYVDGVLWVLGTCMDCMER